MKRLVKIQFVFSLQAAKIGTTHSKMNLYFMDSTTQSGELQMRLDEQAAKNFHLLALPERALLLRLYKWRPFAISLGYNQNENDFDKEKLMRSGIDLVRRPTGGRAVFHIDELTYSVVTRGVKSNSQHYSDINRALQAGLLLLGIQTDFQKQQPDFRRRYASLQSVPCFTASARYELEFNGKKLIGSAQRKFGETLLQHGSLMLTAKHRELTNYLATNDEQLKSQIKKDLDEKTISLSEIIGRLPTDDELKFALKAGFEQIFHTAFQPIEPTLFNALTNL